MEQRSKLRGPVSRQVPLHLQHLAHRMEQTRHLKAGVGIDRSTAVDLLVKKFSAIDFAGAKRNILPFTEDPKRIEIWSEGFFTAITKDQLITV